MKKRLFVGLLLCILTICLVSAPAFAEGETTPVAKIGDTEYTSLAGAVSAAQAATKAETPVTITLLADVELTSTQEITGDVIIDLNGKTITGQNVRALWVKSGNLTLTGKGTVTTVAAEKDPIADSSSVIRVGDNGSSAASVGLVIDENVTIEAPATYGVTAFGSTTTETVTVAGTIKATGNACALSGNGTDTTTGTSITIKDTAVITATGDNAIYHPQAGTLTIEGGYIEGLGGIEIKAGTATINVTGSPTIVATGEVGHTENNNGCSTSGYAIAAVANKNYQGGNASVSVASGTYEGEVAVLNDNYSSNDTSAAQKAAITVTGGTFSGDVSAYLAEDVQNVEYNTVLKAATCTTNGIGKLIQIVDGETTNSYYVLPAAHTYTAEVTTPATCGKEGLMTYTCSVCDAETEGHSYTEVIPATGEHEFEEATIDATCTEGAKVGLKCKNCDFVGETTAVEGSEPLGHDMQLDKTNKKYKAATCTEAGLDTLKCSRCDATEEKTTDALGHEWDDGVHQEATCTTASGVLYTCTVDGCDATYVDEYPEGVGEPALGHKEEAVEDVPATCKDTGLTGKVICSVCKEVLDEGTVLPIDPDAHTYELTSTLKAATCTTTGIGKYTCTAEGCGASKYATIADGHKWNEGEVTTEATCGEDGVMTYTCSVCSETKTEVIEATGQHEYEETIIPATCTEPEKVGQVCKVCNAEGETQVVAGTEALGHDLALDTGAEDYVAATCTEGGHNVYACSRCDYTEEEDTEPLNHKWDEGEYVEADCEHGGGVKYTCDTCGETMVEEFTGDLAEPALEHKPEAVEDVAATCSEAGWEGKVICSVCEKVLEEGTEIPIDPDAHTYDLTITLKKATCTTTGIGKYTCSGCDATKYATIPAAHNYTEKVTKEATCGEDGEKTYTCSVCNEKTEGYSYTEVIPATDKHIFEEKLIEATCTEGAKVGQVCKVCGAEGETQAVTDSKPLGHDLVLDENNSVAATCEEGGHEVSKCSREGCDYTEEKDTEALGHEWVEGEVIEAGCENGAGIKFTCTRCDATRVEEFTGELAQPATGHDYSIVEVTEPTCKSGGYTTHTCANCGDSYTDSETDPVEDAHVWTLTKTMKEPTCSATGIGKWTCSECEATKYATIPKTEHTFNESDGVVTTEPTCTEEGVLTFTCSVCSEEVTQSIEPTGHKYGDEKLNEDETAVIKECSVCGYIEVIEYLQPCEHETTEIIPGKAATCTETGLTDGEKCSVCGEVLTAQKEIPMIAHTPGEAVEENRTEPTETADGSYDEVIYCTVCETEISRETKPIPATGSEPPACAHENTETRDAKDATCTAEGYTGDTYCTDCNELIEEGKAIPVVGHTEETISGKAATCTETGLTDGVKCSVCGEILTAQEEIPALGHKYAVTDSGYEGTAAYMTYTCSNCGDSYTIWTDGR